MFVAAGCDDAANYAGDGEHSDDGEHKEQSAPPWGRLGRRSSHALWGRLVRRLLHRGWVT